MDLTENTQKKIRELQNLEQNLQSFLAQKQAIQSELNESINALQELEKTDDEVYKITSNIMIKSTKEALKKELEEKKRILDIRVTSIEKQERSLEEKIANFREEISSLIEKESKKK